MRKINKVSVKKHIIFWVVGIAVGILCAGVISFIYSSKIATIAYPTGNCFQKMSDGFYHFIGITTENQCMTGSGRLWYRTSGGLDIWSSWP